MKTFIYILNNFFHYSINRKKNPNLLRREGFEPSIVLPLYTLSKRADYKQSIGSLGKIKSENLNTGCTSASYVRREITTNKK